MIKNKSINIAKKMGNGVTFQGNGKLFNLLFGFNLIDDHSYIYDALNNKLTDETLNKEVEIK